MISKAAPDCDDTALNVDFVRALIEKGILLSPSSARFLINTIDQFQAQVDQLKKQLEYANVEAENQGSWANHYKSKFEEANTEAYEWRDKYAKAYLEGKHQAEKANRWIRIEDGLPKEYQRIFVWCNGRAWSASFATIDGESFFEPMGGGRLYPTHWMPIERPVGG